MFKLFEKLNAVNPNHQNIVMTVLDGDSLGEKALVSNHELVWESKEGGFFLNHKMQIEKIADSGQEEVDGHTVFCELLGREKKMVICGGGHVSIPIIQMGRMLGYKVTVLEDRPKFADHARHAQADHVICEPFDQGLGKVDGDEDTYFIIVTRGHRYDQVCLQSIVRKKHAYIGMIGSRKRVAKVKEAIIENGGDQEIVNQVYTPIGLDIGAETPEEIAVAILAEIIEVKNRKKRNCGYSREIVGAVLDEENRKEPKVLATIVARKGSAPREVGTKMLVLPDGRTFGTIGGGCAEADILRMALSILRNREQGAKLCHVDMTGKDAEDEGMVCGGIIDVLLETV